jgi:hypothetical protein
VHGKPRGLVTGRAAYARELLHKACRVCDLGRARCVEQLVSWMCSSPSFWKYHPLTAVTKTLC